MSDELPTNVVALGVFDGVHIGHKELLRVAEAFCTSQDRRLLAVSFDPHPAKVLAPAKFKGLLTTPHARAKLLLDNGADQVDFINFTQEISQHTPEQFVEKFVVQKWRATHVVVGENFRFGQGASATAQDLFHLGQEFGFRVEVVPLLKDVDAISSSRIRHLISVGQVDSAAKILGRNYELSGQIVTGDQRGREIGFPTANLDCDEDLLIPAPGVYAAIVEIDNQSFPAALSIGNNPTFTGVLATRVEAHLLDVTGLDLYGKRATFAFVKQIRDMVKFDSIDELITAIARDVAEIRLVFKEFGLFE